MRQFVAVKIDLKTHEHIELHKFLVPRFGEAGFYRSTLTLSAFAHNADEKRCRGCWSPKYLYMVKRWEDFIAEAEGLVKFFVEHDIRPLDDRELPVVEHATIWEFYKHQGYDYKRKKWIPQEGINA